MISIRESVSELDRFHELCRTTLQCYVAAIRNAARYAVEIDESITNPHRSYLDRLALEVEAGNPAAVAESSATFRGLLRDYRDKAAHYICGLRQELATSARTLEQILSDLAKGDGDAEVQLRETVQRLREISTATEDSAIRPAIKAAAARIEEGVEQMCKQHQLAMTQFQVEIRLLHNRIDALEKAAMIDDMTKLLNRAEMEERIRTAPPESFTLVLMRTTGLRNAERIFNASVAAELAAAFGKRLQNSLPPDAEIGRWSEEGFLAKVMLPKREAMSTAKWIAGNLSGSYACMLEGTNVRPTLQISVAVADRLAGEPPEKTIQKIADFCQS